MSLESEFYGSLAPEDRLCPSAWAARHRVLGPEESAEPGTWSNDRTPYLTHFMDLVGSDVEEVVLLKGAQIGYSEACRNLIGWWIDQQPGPILVVLPDQKSADNWRDERLAPLMKHTPTIARHLTSRAWDATKHRVQFDNNAALYMAWAGSSQSLKTRPIRYLVLEEPDEYPVHSGTGGDPVAKALRRITTFADKGLARVLLGGTPTTRHGQVWKRWETCPVHLHPWVPCPHCGRYQVLQWAQVKWPGEDQLGAGLTRAQRAEVIDRDLLAWYECDGCKCKIADHHKPAMLRRIRWASDDQAINAQGEVVGPTIRSRHVGMRISSLYSPWVSFSRLACEWLQSQGDTAALMDFFNQRLSEPFEEQRAKIEAPLIAAKAKTAGPAALPDWAILILATADVQMNGMYFVVRAWGHELRSKLLHYGAVTTWSELRRETLERTFGRYMAERLVVDAGYKKPEVDQFALSDTARINTAKGLSTYTGPIAEPRLEKVTGILVWNINTMQSKDRLHSLIHDPDPARWLPHEAVGPDYCEQLASEHKVWHPRDKAELWVKRTSHAANHYWDCESMQVAIASIRGCAQPAPAPAPRPAAEPAKGNDWMNGRPEGWIK